MREIPEREILSRFLKSWHFFFFCFLALRREHVETTENKQPVNSNDKQQEVIKAEILCCFL